MPAQNYYASNTKSNQKLLIILYQSMCCFYSKKADQNLYSKVKTFPNGPCTSAKGGQSWLY